MYAPETAFNVRRATFVAVDIAATAASSAIGLAWRVSINNACAPVTATTQIELGNTEAQTDCILFRIDSTLMRRGRTMGDVVKLTIYLVGAPDNGRSINYAGTRL